MIGALIYLELVVGGGLFDKEIGVSTSSAFSLSLILYLILILDMLIFGCFRMLFNMVIDGHWLCIVCNSCHVNQGFARNPMNLSQG